MQTQHWLCQSRTHLPICSRRHALSIGTTHWCTIVPEDANRMGYLAKVEVRTTFFAFKGNSSAAHTETQQQSFLFNPWNSSKNMHTVAPSLMQAMSMRKFFNHKSLLRWTHILTWPQQKHANLCASLVTVYPICMDVQTDAMKPHYSCPWTIGSMQSAIAKAIYTLWSSFLPLWHASLCIMSIHSSQITSQATCTSAPLWRRISTTSFHPSCADANKGVAPFWGIQHVQQMQTHKRGWSANKCWTISIYCPSCSHSNKRKHSIGCIKA